MLKFSTIAAVSLAALVLMPLPGISTSAFAAVGAAGRQPCTAGPNCPPKGGSGGDTYTCSTELGYLRRVYEEELEAIAEPQYVSIVPVCMGEEYGMMRSEGNAGALRQVIASNDAMTEALDRADFGSDDVVAIRMTGEDKVILYVHPFHH